MNIQLYCMHVYILHEHTIVLYACMYIYCMNIQLHSMHTVCMHIYCMNIQLYSMHTVAYIHLITDKTLIYPILTIQHQKKELPNLFLPKIWFIPNPCISLRYQPIIPIPSLNNYERCLIRPSSLPAMRNRGLTEDCGFKSSRYNSIYFLISIKIEVSMVTNL